MACNYSFIVNESELEGLSLPAPSGDDSVENFIAALAKNPEQAKQLVNIVQKAQKKQAAITTKPLKSIDKNIALLKVAEKLSSLGIKVWLGDQKQFDSLGIFPSGTKAGVYNGDIYINIDKDTGADITTPMHEFLHLVFAVMKAENFNAYNTLMKAATKNKPFNDLRENLPNEYKKMSELDIQEEVLLRLFEEILQNNSVSLDVFGAENYEIINSILAEYIQKTFNIDQVVDVIDFLKSPFSDLTRQGSTLFIRKNKVIPYFNYKEKVRQQEMISSLISILSDVGIVDENGELQKIERECE